MVTSAAYGVELTNSICIVANRVGCDSLTHELAEGNTVVVGASEGCGMRLVHESVAPRHCILTLCDGELIVRQWTEVASFLNGRQVQDEATLQLGDKLGVGDYTLEFQRPSVSPSEPPKASFQERESRPSLELATASETPRPDPLIPVDAPSVDDPVSELKLGDPSPDAGHPVADLPPKSPPVAPAEPEPSTSLWDEPVLDECPVDEDTISLLNGQDEAKAEAEASSLDMDWAGEEFADETIDLLRDEVVALENELQERKTMLAELTNGAYAEPATQESSETLDEAPILARIDEMLDELAKSDERVALLEEMLSASEDATNAEQEERRQLQSWVEDIEGRISSRQSEWEEEIESLREQVTRLKSQRDEVEQQLHNAASVGDSQRQYEGLLKRLRAENADLEQRLEQSETQRESLQNHVQSAEFQRSAEGQREVVERALREERAKLAQEWASVSRSRAELAAKLKEAEERRDASPANAADQRVQALREHLKEIHDNEQHEETDKGLISRLAGLWQRLD